MCVETHVCIYIIEMYATRIHTHAYNTRDILCKTNNQTESRRAGPQYRSLIHICIIYMHAYTHTMYMTSFTKNNLCLAKREPPCGSIIWVATV